MGQTDRQTAGWNAYREGRIITTRTSAAGATRRCWLVGMASRHRLMTSSTEMRSTDFIVHTWVRVQLVMLFIIPTAAYLPRVPADLPMYVSGKYQPLGATTRHRADNLLAITSPLHPGSFLRYKSELHLTHKVG